MLAARQAMQRQNVCMMQRRRQACRHEARGRAQRTRAVKPTGSFEEQDVWPSRRILEPCYLPPLHALLAGGRIGHKQDCREGEQ